MTSSPGTTGPTPDGVPVRMRSPSCNKFRFSDVHAGIRGKPNLEGHNGGDVMDQPRNAKYHIRGSAILFELIVDLDVEMFKPYVDRLGNIIL